TYLTARLDRRIVGVLPLVQINSRVFGRSLTSLPFVNYGGIVAESPEARDALLQAAAAVARAGRCSPVELRHRQRQMPSPPCKQHQGALRPRPPADQWPPPRRQGPPTIPRTH